MFAISSTSSIYAVVRYLHFVATFPQSAAIRRTIPAYFDTPNPHILSHDTHHILPHQTRNFVATYPHILSHRTVAQLQNVMQLQNWVQLQNGI